MGSRWWVGVLAAGLWAAPHPARAVCNFTTNKVQTLNGTTLTYRVTITNNTGSGFCGVTISDTVSPVLVNQTSSCPPQFGSATIYNTASGTLYVWSYEVPSCGKSELGNGATWTFTVTGTIPDACALFGISNTAVFHVSGSGCSGISAEGVNTVGTASNLAIDKLQTPAGPVAGGPVSYAIHVTNTGTTTLTSLAVTDTVATAITGVAAAAPAGFTASGPVATGGGNWWGWRDTGSLTFTPGAVLTFTLTGTVAGTCVTTEVSNTAYATGLTTGCGSSATSVISNVTSFTIPSPPAGLAVDLAQAGGGGIGAPVEYRITVTNNGAATLTSFTVTDTVAPFVAVTGSDQPPGFGAPVVTSVAGGTRYDWSATGLTLYPTGSFTFTITGAMGVVCAPVTVSNTAYVTVAAACAEAALLSAAVGGEVLPVAGSVALAAAQTPPSPGVGQPVTWRLVVTNTGAATLASLTLSDTIPALVTGVVSAEPAGWSAATAAAAGPGATRFSWSNLAAGFLPGTSLTFTLTGVVGDVCAVIAVTTTAFVTGGWACPGAAEAFSNETGFDLPAPPAGVDVVLLQAGGGPAGSPLSYRIVVTNTGSATIRNLTVTDTVDAAVVGQTTDQPAEMGAPVAVNVAPSGTRWVWSAAAMATGLEPGRSFTFTVTGVVGVVCAPTAISNTAYLEFTAACSATGLLTNPVESTAVPPVAGLAVLTAQTPAGPLSGQAVSYRIVVTNLGGATLTGMTVTDTVSPVVMVTAVDEPAGWAAPVVSQVGGGGTLYAWTNNALTLSPLASLTFTITGTVGTCYLGVVSNTPFVTAGNACASAAVPGNVTAFALGGVLAASTSVRPTVSVGQIFDVVLTVTNVGSDSADFVTPAVAVGPGAARVMALSGPSPAGPLLLAPGVMATFTWTYSATASGAAVFTATASGASCGAATFAGSSSAVTQVQTPPFLAAALAAFPTPRNIGQRFYVTLTVTNTGEASAQGVLPLSFRVEGAPAVTLLGGPLPAPPVMLAGGASITFTWSFSGSPEGTVKFSTTAAGTDANTGLAAAAGVAASGTVLIQIPAALAGSVPVVTPSPVCQGQTATIVMTVTNTGQATALNVTPSVSLFLDGTTIGTRVSSPAVLASLAGGAAAKFTWVYTAGPSGILGFTATITGTDANDAAALTTGPRASGTVAVSASAVLSGAASARGTASVGQWFEVVLTVTNTGGDVATAVTPVAVPVLGPGAGRATLVLGPSPAGAPSLGIGVAQSFTWTYSSTAAGFVTFSLSAAGTSCAGVAAVIGKATVSATMQTPAALQGVLTSFPSPRNSTQTFLVTLTVTNTGQAAALGLANPGLVQSGGTGGAAQTAGPTPAFGGTLSGGQAVTWTWTFTAGAPGTFILSTSVSASDANTGTAVTTGTVTANTVVIQTPAALSATGWISQPQISTGQWIVVTLTVSNTGGASLSGVVPALVNGSSAPLTLIGGPVPAGPLPLGSGSATVFVWTWSSNGAGTLAFGLSATGLDANSGTTVFASSSPAGVVQVPASLAASMAVSATVVVPGSLMTVAVTVTNTGGATTRDIQPVAPVVAGGAGALLVAGPSATMLLAGGSATTWVWTYSMTGGGFVSFTASPAGTGFDINSGRPVRAIVAQPAPVQVGMPSLAIIGMVASPGVIGLDRIITLVMTVSNTGRFLLQDIAPELVTVAGDGLVVLVTGPAPAVASNVMPGQVVSFTWTYRTLRGGTVTFAADAAALEVVPVPPAVSNPVRITEAGGTLADAIVYPTPFDPGRALGGTLKFRRMPPGATAAIYTNAGGLVRTLTADANGLAEWDARNDRGTRVFPGVFFYLLRSPQGEVRQGKFEVSR